MRDTEVTKECKVRIDKRKVTGWAGGRAGVVTCEEPMTYRRRKYWMVLVYGKPDDCKLRFLASDLLVR